MSENLGSTQPTQPFKDDDTQPVKAVKKSSRWRSILIGVLGFLLLIGLGGFSGYSSGITVRKAAKDEIVSQQLSEQYTLALVDIEFGRYETAKERLQFIIENNSEYPGAKEKLTEVFVLSSIPTPTTAPTLTATPDFTGAESAYQRAQQLILAQDWPGALTALDTIRKLDPTYKTAQVDGMYYFALRNNGYDLITKQGNLEGGIYYLTLAERFGPLDNTAVGLREGARMYITGASFWQLDWKQAVDYFAQVSAGWPSLWDGTMTASDRYHFALMRYGDELFIQQSYCSASEQYTIAATFGALDQPAAGNADDAFIQCYPATPTLEAATVTLEVPPVVIDTPTDTPVP
jgi:tetratricopeptide (TPR) repeat protein